MEKRSGFRLPNQTERVMINGHTGCGKTTFAAWLLSEANYNKQPWIIMDVKGDKLLRSIDRAVPLTLTEKLPKKPGIYYLRPPVGGPPQPVEDFLMRVLKQGKIGLFADEAYMLPYQRRENSAVKAILSQGRSLEIPVYAMTQRPVACNRSFFTEADFYAYFHMNDEADQKRVTQFTPSDSPVWNMRKRLPDYYVRWHDTKADFSCVLAPCPNDEAILERFDERLRPKKTFL